MSSHTPCTPLFHNQQHHVYHPNAFHHASEAFTWPSARTVLIARPGGEFKQHCGTLSSVVVVVTVVRSFARSLQSSKVPKFLRFKARSFLRSKVPKFQSSFLRSFVSKLPKFLRSLPKFPPSFVRCQSSFVRCQSSFLRFRSFVRFQSSFVRLFVHPNAVLAPKKERQHAVGSGQVFQLQCIPI